LNLNDCIDLDRYPIHELDSPAGSQLVQQCRTSLHRDGVCLLDGFVREGTISDALGAAQVVADRAWTADQGHNVYFQEVPAEGDPDDPRLMLQRSRQHAIAYDLLPDDLALRVVYEAVEVTTFIATVLELDVVYPSADPLDALELSLFTPGDELGWHFDNSDFSVTLMLQPAQVGGHFDYVPSMRSANDDNHQAVADFLKSPIEFTRLHPAAGTLSLFKGRLALHRVSPVGGATTRINAVMSYGDRPDMRLSDLTRMLFYGRLA
jgi:hypothetical protein